MYQGLDADSWLILEKEVQWSVAEVLLIVIDTEAFCSNIEPLLFADE